MRSLLRSAQGTKEHGDYLPCPFAPLTNHHIRARFGTWTVVAGPPGAFKTGFVLYWLLRINLPTLYLSADAESFEIVERCAAAVTGVPMNQIRHDAIDLEGAGSNLRFCYEDSPTYEFLFDEVSAWLEMHGAPPKVIVIDNLMNLVGEQESEWASMRDSARVLHRLTRITGAATFALHHMADDRQDPSVPAPRSKLQGKVGHLPKAILSLALADNELRIAAVKNRWGPADPSGRSYATLFAAPRLNRIYNSRADYLQGNSA